MTDNSFKVVLIGGSNVGKTAIFRRFIQDEFLEKGTKATVSANFREKEVDVMGSKRPIRI